MKNEKGIKGEASQGSGAREGRGGGTERMCRGVHGPRLIFEGVFLQ